ncbi:MAG: hypothetical protein IKO65_02665 [Victivallales bacterium]|nr:hypothetical protein [Victivallales bacterium]
MAGETIKCPHCECKVNISDVEKEDGFCPECGQLITSTSPKDPYEQGDLDDEELTDEYGDEYEPDNDEDSEYEDDMEPDFGEELDDDGFFDEEVKPKRQRGGMAMGSIGGGGGGGSRRKPASSSSSAPSSRKSSSSSGGRGSRKK